MCQLLGSKNNTDVEQSIHFFVTAKSFSIEASQEGVRKMLMLIWSKEANIKAMVIDAYDQLYIKSATTGNSNKEDPWKVAKNLIGYDKYKRIISIID